MARSWTGKSEYRAISLELFSSEGLAFQRLVLPLIRIIWSETVETPAGWTLDRQGVDLLVWSEGTRFPLVVQCKGFHVSEEEIGLLQAQQCRKSIEKFLKTGPNAERYILVHNREGRNSEFRKLVQDTLCILQASGKVVKAELWNRQRLVKEALDAMIIRFDKSVAKKNLSLINLTFESQETGVTPIESVPIETSVINVDQHKLRSTKHRSCLTADPVDLIDFREDINLIVLIGEYGFGKTTALIRALERSERQLFYVPGATISETTQSTKDFLIQCLDVDSVFDDLSETDRTIAVRLLRPVVEYAFKISEFPVILVIDALDESAFLARRGGLQHLFNIIRTVKVPVILAMRTEFWRSRHLEFSSTVGTIAPEGKKNYVNAQLIELMPWNDTEILVAIKRRYEKIEGPIRRKRLLDLTLLVKSGKFLKYYGDIPRRPLFLKFIMDSVEEKGIPENETGLAKLFTEWARMKIMRDITAPVRAGGIGRAPILSPDESSETTIELAWEAMQHAACSMTQIFSGNLELLSSCSLHVVLESNQRLCGISDPTGLVLNSLLTLDKPRTGFETPIISFTHRSFQEFFLAWFLTLNPEYFGDISIPEAIENWMSHIKSEQLIG